METSFFGQAIVQSPHPLQRISSIMICGIGILPLLISDPYLYQIEKLRVKLPCAKCGL